MKHDFLYTAFELSPKDRDSNQWRDSHICASPTMATAVCLYLQEHGLGTLETNNGKLTFIQKSENLPPVTLYMIPATGFIPLEPESDNVWIARLDCTPLGKININEATEFIKNKIDLVAKFS